jgi:hypothetical protein
MKSIVSHTKGLIFIFILYNQMAHGQMSTASLKDRSTVNLRPAFSGPLTSSPIVIKNSSHTLPFSARIQKDKEIEDFYIKLTATFSQIPLQALNRYPAARFTYKYIGMIDVYHYSDSTRLRTHNVLNGFSGGFELGNPKGWFVGANYGGFFIANSSDFESLQIGYNLMLPVKRFTLQPSVSFMHVQLITDLKPIYAKRMDIIAFGKTFPYHTCGCGYSDLLEVKTYNNLRLFQYKLTLNYTVSKYFSFQLGTSFWMSPSVSTDLYLKNKSKEKLIKHEGFTARDAGQSDFDIHSGRGFYLETSILYKFRLLKTKPGPVSSSRSHHYSGSSSHYHSSSCRHR